MVCSSCSLSGRAIGFGTATILCLLSSLQYLARQQQLDEASFTMLFEKASEWYEYHGLFDEAIDTALSAKLFDRAMTLIEKFIEIHDMSELRTIGRWLEAIPQSQMLSHPMICFTYGQVILYSTDRFAPATAARIEPFLPHGGNNLATSRGSSATRPTAFLPWKCDMVAGRSSKGV